jgi:DNA repair ATPase RecN
MDDFTRLATDIGRQIEDRQQLIRSSSETEQRKIQSLQDLLQRIGASGDAFDQEDRNAVLAEISAREQVLQKIQKEAKRQEEIRRQKEAILLQLHTVLTTRTKVLDQMDEDSSVLREHDALLSFFAQKQVQLMEMLKSKMKELLEAMPMP